LAQKHTCGGGSEKTPRLNNGAQAMTRIRRSALLASAALLCLGAASPAKALVREEKERKKKESKLWRRRRHCTFFRSFSSLYRRFSRQFECKKRWRLFESNCAREN